MEENAHCPSPEKLSSLAFCFSMNSLCPAESSRVQRDKAVHSELSLVGACARTEA